MLDLVFSSQSCFYLGMASTSCDRKVLLDTWLPEVNNMLVFSGTTGYIQPDFHRKNRDTIVKNDNGNSLLKFIFCVFCIMLTNHTCSFDNIDQLQ